MSSTTTPIPPSGNGHSRETAQWSHAFANNPAQAAYVVEIALPAPSKWRVCTKNEVIYYQESGYQVWRIVDGRKTVFRIRERDPNAEFANQFFEIVGAERELETAGVSATYDEELAEGELLDTDHDAQMILMNPGSSEDTEDVSTKGVKTTDAASVGEVGSHKTPSRSGGGVVDASSASSNTLSCIQTWHGGLASEASIVMELMVMIGVP